MIKYCLTVGQLFDNIEITSDYAICFYDEEQEKRRFLYYTPFVRSLFIGSIYTDTIKMNCFPKAYTDTIIFIEVLMSNSLKEEIEQYINYNVECIE